MILLVRKKKRHNEFKLLMGFTERPPSPESPKARRFVIHELMDRAQKDSRPSPLEPLPQFNEQKPMFPLSLFELLPPTHACITPSAIQIPIPRRSSPPLSRYQYQDPFFKAIQSSPMSPTMAAASASAAASAAHRHPGSQVAASLLKSIQSENKTEATLAFSDCYPKHKTSKRGNVDQSMFLTKNDHIKRPRNAWIHVSPNIREKKNRLNRYYTSSDVIMVKHSRSKTLHYARKKFQSKQRHKLNIIY